MVTDAGDQQPPASAIAIGCTGEATVQVYVLRRLAGELLPLAR